MTGQIGRVIDAERAVDWVRRSLAQGSDLAALVGAALASFEVAVLLVDEARSFDFELVLDDMGRGVPSAEADDVARRLLASIAVASKMTLIVEDDLARRGDPHVERAALVGDRVLRWEEIVGDASAAATLLRRGSSGYPLNAYVCSGTASGLGLAIHAEVEPAVQHRIAEAVVGVLASAWDAEVFIAVLAPTLCA